MTPGAELLRVEGLSRKGVLHDISFSCAPARSWDSAGLMGAGRTELCRAMFGIDPIDCGRDHRVQGKPITSAQSARCGARRHRADPEDRGRDGLARQLPIAYNVTAASLGRLSSLGLPPPQRRSAVTSEYVGKLRIKCSSGAQLAGRLSGGNQQKVVIAKWLARGAKVFLFDEPTRGIDVGAKVEVFEVMDSWREPAPQY